MVEKIYLTPESVRGLGNIVSPKSYTDFKGNYSEIYVNENGDFVLGYDGYIILFNTRVSDTIKGSLASLTVTVLTAEDLQPVTNHSVEVTIDESTLTEVTDSSGVAVFTWTPTELGETTITISCSKQGDYAQHSEDLTVTVGVLLALNLIMTGMTCEDDEYYEGTFEQQVESRTQLGRFITDVQVASGGERVVDNDGYMRVATDGDLLVSYDSIDDNPDYWNVLFEEEVDRLVGAVTGVSITSDEDIVLTRLERADIVDDGPAIGSIGLVSDGSSVYMSSSRSLTATVLDEDSEPLADVTVSFLEDGVNRGTAVTDSNGVAVFTYHPSSVGTHSLVARVGSVSSSSVSISASKGRPAFGQFAVSPTTCFVGDSVSVSGLLSTVDSRPVSIYDGDSLLTTVYTGSDRRFSASLSSLASGSHSIKAVFLEDDVYLGNETDPVSVTVSKRSATLSLSSSASSVTLGDSFTLSGTLSVGSGQSVLLYRNDHYVETLTTGTNGSFSKTVTEASTGSYSYYVLFESTSVYSRVQSATVSVSVHDVAPVYDDIVLTADDSILSYYDGDSTTLRAQLMDGTSTASVSGVTVEFFNGSTSLGTAQTDSNGVATKTYTSTGVGEISLTASDGTLSSEICSIEDCIYAYLDELSYTSSSTLVSSTIIEMGNINTLDFEMEFDIKSNGDGGGLNIGASSQHTPPSSANYREFIGTDSHKFSFNNRTNTSSNTTVGTVTDNTYYHMKLTKNGTSFVGYYGDNDTVIATKNATWISNYTSYNLYWINWSSTNYVKNIKIKPL